MRWRLNLFDVCIIGAGIQGCSAALHLAKAGASVAVFDCDYPGRNASGVNAGGVRRLNRHPAEIPLALAADEMWQRIGDLVDDDCGYVRTANVKIAENEADLRKIEDRLRTVRSLGYAHEEFLPADRVRDLVPRISASVCGALYCDGDGYASPFRTTHAFFAKAEREGARFFLGEAVEGLSRSGDRWCVKTGKRTVEAATIVNCAGAWANAIAGMTGDPAPIRAEAPMMMITARTPHFLDQIIGLVGHRLSFKQRENGTLLIGGGYRGEIDENGLTSSVNVDRLRENAEAVLRVFPDLRDLPVVRAWSGVEAMTPDHLPVIGRSCEHDNVFHAFGFSAHGFALGPIVGRILAELVQTGQTGLPIEPFRITRFNE